MNISLFLGYYKFYMICRKFKQISFFESTKKQIEVILSFTFLFFVLFNIFLFFLIKKKFGFFMDKLENKILF